MTVGRKKILVVDDEEYARKLIIASLRKSNYDILQAEGGRQAIALAIEEHPDLIIMDVCLAETQLDGYQTAKIIREQFPGQAFLFVSGSMDRERQRTAAGRPLFLKKPFSPIELRSQVSRILGGKNPPKSFKTRRTASCDNATDRETNPTT